MQVKAPNLLRQAVLATTGWAGLFNSFKFTRVKTWGVTICTRMAFLLTTIASVLKHKMVGIMDVTTKLPDHVQDAIPAGIAAAAAKWKVTLPTDVSYEFSMTARRFDPKTPSCIARDKHSPRSAHVYNDYCWLQTCSQTRRGWYNGVLTVCAGVVRP